MKGKEEEGKKAALGNTHTHTHTDIPPHLHTHIYTHTTYTYTYTLYITHTTYTLTHTPTIQNPTNIPQSPWPVPPTLTLLPSMGLRRGRVIYQGLVT